MTGRMTAQGVTLALALATLIAPRLVAAGGECETKCGDSEGQPALCQHFCAQSSDQPLTVLRKNSELGAGVQNLFSLLDWMEHTLALNKDQEKIIAQVEDRIIGGEVADVGQFPFAASLKIKGFRRYIHFCGGSALSNTFVITAAHCVVDVKIKRLYVSVGDHDTSKQDNHERIIQAEKIIIHLEYNPNNFLNDIALIKLKKPFRVHNHRQIIEMMRDPMALEKKLEEGSRVKMTVLGWGTMREGGRPAKKLRWVEVPYVSHEECRRAMRPHKIYKSMTCAGYIRQGGKDACQGDSGGPLVYRVVSRKTNMTRDSVTTQARVTTRQREAKTFLFDINQEIGDLLNVDDDYEDNYDYTNEVSDRLDIPHAYILAGLVSWGVGCAKPNYAGVYTNVASYAEWIDKNMKYN